MLVERGTLLGPKQAQHEASDVEQDDRSIESLA